MERDGNNPPHDPSGAAALGATHSAYEPVADTGFSLREQASGFKDTFADVLQSGADKLRLRATDETSITSREAGGAFNYHDRPLGRTSNRIAGGMEGVGDWLRDVDLDGLKRGIGRQLKGHPGRSLAIAAGVGYLLGKAFRRR